MPEPADPKQHPHPYVEEKRQHPHKGVVDRDRSGGGGAPRGGGDKCGGDVAAAYAELHCVSNFSFLRGASHPEELVEQAAALGYEALAITDCNSFAGVVRAHLAAERHGIRLIVGAEFTPVDGLRVVLLAPERRVYGRLARLISRGRLRAEKGGCALQVADIAALGPGAIAIAVPPAAPLASIDRKRLLKQLRIYREIFGRDLHLAAALAYTQPDARRLADLRALERASGIPLVATNDVHYHVPQRRYLQDVLTCVRERCTLRDAGRRLFPNAERHLRPRAEIARRYGAYPELLTRAVSLGRRCQFKLSELRYDYPHELVPAGCEPMDYLEALTWQGAAERYFGERLAQYDPAQAGRDLALLRATVGSRLPGNVRKQLEHELSLIRELKYEHYFLTVWDIVRFARRRGILCQGRGSAANSAVCYCLCITAVDPARVNLLFERFISRERNEPPDIDVDFEHERREEVFQYIYQKYGRERAGITAEVITYRPRSAVRDVGKALGLSLDRIDVLAKSLDWWHREGLTEEAIRNAGLEPGNRTLRMLVRLVRQVLGFPRHLSQHVGGFVITETPLCELVPLENGAMPDRTFIQWDKDDIDALGFLKIDCLALGMLTAIGKAFGEIKNSRAQEIKRRDRGWRGHSGVSTRQEAHQIRSHFPKQSLAEAPGTRKPENDEQEKLRGQRVHCSRLARVAESDHANERDLSLDEGASGFRAFRTIATDAESHRISGEQHCGRGRTAATERILALLKHRARITGRTGNTTHHHRRTRDALHFRWRMGNHRGSRAPSASVDDESGTKNTVAKSPSVPESLGPLVPLSLATIPPEDPVVYDMICAADTVGVFQIESRAQMSMLPRLKPRCYYDLVIEVAIVRPGPIQGGMVHPYLRRRDGIEAVSYPSDAVRGVLEKTLGVPLFQEQVMKLAVVAAGFTPGEADQLRRAMAAWRKTGSLGRFEDKLIQGMLRNGYERGFAEQIFKQIQGFGEYGFPESHAASFALLVYASCWLKCYYPAAFCTAMLNSQPLGFYTPGQLIRDARAHGVEVRPIDVNHSGWDCGLEAPSAGKPAPDPDLPAPHRHGQAGPAVRLGLRLVRGLSAEKVRGVLAARQVGEITSVRALALRDDVSRGVLLRLAAADAFRSLGLGRRAALWQILTLHDNESAMLAKLPDDSPPQSLPALRAEEGMAADYESQGFSLAHHPLGLVRRELDGVRLTPADLKQQTLFAVGPRKARRKGGGVVRIRQNADLQQARAREPVAVAGLVTLRQRPGTARGIVFITLEDETGMANLVVHAHIWERDWRIARGAIGLVAAGHIERQHEVVHVIVRRLYDLGELLCGVTHRSRDFH